MRGPGKAKGGRLWLEVDEIEAAAESALQAAGLFPWQPGPVDIEALLEVHLGASVDYGGRLPSDILGYTLFDEPPRVVVNGRLTELATAPNANHGVFGRWRATLAHEAAHIILHTAVMGVGSEGPQLTLATVESGPSDDIRNNWREVQANMGMAALLMPRGPFLAESRDVLESAATLLPLDRESLAAERLVSILAHRFETSREATTWRLRNLGWLPMPRRN